jgi:hypothetical protein
MRLLAHHELNGFGNCGEGMAIQLAGDGRRVRGSPTVRTRTSRPWT